MKQNEGQKKRPPQREGGMSPGGLCKRDNATNHSLLPFLSGYRLTR
jgi:hypothetical protein